MTEDEYIEDAFRFRRWINARYLIVIPIYEPIEFSLDYLDVDLFGNIVTLPVMGVYPVFGERFFISLQ